MRLLQGTFAICQLPPGESIPGWAWAGEFCCCTVTPQELSLVCSDEAVPPGVTSQAGWRALEVKGPLDPNSTGVIARLSSALAEASIPLCVISTYGTDYLMVRDQDLGKAIEVLEGRGNKVRSSSGRMKGSL